VSSPSTTFDPRGLLAALDRHRVAYIIVGAFARVVQGADEITRGIDIVPSMREDNLRRLAAALTDLGARGPDGSEPSLADSDRQQLEPVLELTTDRGELQIIPEPTGTGGYEDLRRAATREHIGQGLRPQVASLGDLTRMLSSLGREDDLPKVLDLRRLAELEISQGIEI
jgi:hypothetical protein